MKFKLNPITGDLDRVTGNWNYIQKLNPITGKFNLVDSADSYKQIINPLTGNFQLWNEWGSWPTLPAWYARLEYIESTGTQYIDTWIVLNSEATITFVWQATSYDSVWPYSFWGFMADGTMPRWTWAVYQNKWLIDVNTTAQSGAHLADTNKHTFVNYIYRNENNNLYYNGYIDWTKFYDNDVLVPSPNYYEGNTLSSYIFARHYAGVSNFLNCRIFSFKIEQDWVVVFDAVPVERYDWIYWLYDFVSETFFYNQWTNDFVPWPYVLPEGYTQDEYYVVKGSALPYWIDTGIKPTYNMAVKWKYSVYHNSSIYILWARATQSEQGLTRPQTMTFSWSQNWGTVTAFVGWSSVTAKTNGTNWARIAGQENKYEIDVTIWDYVEWEPTIFTTNFYDLINEVSDLWEVGSFVTDLDEFTPTIYLGWNWNDTESAFSRLYFLDLAWGTERRRYVPATHWEDTGFYEIFNHEFIS